MRKELEDIIFLGKVTTKTELLGKAWTLQLVDVVKYANIIKQINTNDNALNVILLKKNMIKEAIVSVDDIEIKENEREQFINALPFQIIDALFAKYTEMADQFSGNLTKEDVEEIKN